MPMGEYYNLFLGVGVAVLLLKCPHFQRNKGKINIR